MHEWALAEATVATVRREAACGAPGARVTRVQLAFGELQGIDRDLFAVALADLAPAAGIDATAFQIGQAPARFACRACTASWTLADLPDLDDVAREAIHLLPEAAHAYLRCPRCGSVDFDVTAGRGVIVEAIEVA